MPEPHPSQYAVKRGGAWVLAQSILMATVFLLAVFFNGTLPGTFIQMLGAVLLLAGGCLGIAGARTLGRNLTPFPRPTAGAELVRHGIYSRVRHPLYTCVMLTALGWALVWQSMPATIATLALVPFFRAKARGEEQWLRERFPGYADYVQSVPAFLPRLRCARKPDCNL